MLHVVKLLLLVAASGQFCQATFLGFIDEAVPRHTADGDHIPDITLNAGETIELTCAAANIEVIAWKYPRQQIDGENSTAVTEVSRHTSNSDGEEITPYYTSKLIITNTTHQDSGEYECFCSGMDNIAHLHSTHIGRKLISKRDVYVYVTDRDNLFVGEPSTDPEPISAVSRGTIILPCAVTNPNVTVELVKEKGYNREVVIARDGKKFQYDPKLGFVISRLMLRDTGMYKCRAIDGDYIETKPFYLQVMRSQPLLQKPVLKGSHQVAIGRSAVFKCHVAAGKHQLTSISWWKKVGDTEVSVDEDPRIVVGTTLLSTDMCNGNRTMCSFKRSLQSSSTFEDISLYIRLTGRMRIDDAQPSQSGAYYCKAWSSGLTLQSNVIDLQVTGPAIIIADHDGTQPMPEYTVVHGA